MQLSCPHCGESLQPFSLPENGGWDSPFHLACFNDECPYFVKGWEWMEEEFGVKSSYRYRIDPATGKASPIGVWSKDALKSRMLDAEVDIEDQEKLETAKEIEP